MTLETPGLRLAGGPETARIRAFLEAAAGRAGSGEAATVPAGIEIAPGDDAAALRPPRDERLVVSVDASVEAIHFRREWMTWETIGYRAAASALSDLAAMAAAPIGLLVSAALPPELGVETAAALGDGVGEALARSGGTLLGGDLVASPGPVFLDVTVLGSARVPLRRDGARPGDELWLTGEVGGAASAVHDLAQALEPLPGARARLERPRPRIAEARWLAERADLHAAIDLSDGLARDAAHLAAASGVELVIEASRVPTPAELDGIRASAAGTRLLLAGGEDYELLLAAPPGALSALRRDFAARFGIPLTRIGRIAAGTGLAFEGLEDGEPPGGFEHFGGG